MQTLCVVGDGSWSAVRRLADRLTADREGRVATVDHTGTADHADTPSGASDDAAVAGGYLDEGGDYPDADGVFRIDADGQWIGSGTDRSPMDLLDSLAPTYDYALVAGLTHHRLPTVVLGDAEAAPSAEVVATAPTADALDVGSVVDRIDDVEPHVTLETLIERAKAAPQADRSGAIATFTGRVRAKDSPDDSRTEHLSFEKYAGVAEERLEVIQQELTERDGVFEVLCHHRVGLLNDGEDIVFVVVLAGHRQQAFRTVEDGIDRLKDEVPIFKKETTTDEEFWLHERE